MKLVGITGGIGSGKSMVSKILETMGYAVYDSDKRAKELYFKPNIKASVTQLLGAHSYHADGTLNKAYIGTKVFSNTSELKALEQILHPAVKSDFLDWQKEHQSSTVLFKESALIFEKQLDKELDAVILVVASMEERINRIMQRDHISEAQIRERIDKQLSDEEKLKCTDLVVKNSENSLILPQIIEILRRI
jgi:dephospho-CoA kinase